jgi:flagellar protein FliS
MNLMQRNVHSSYGAVDVRGRVEHASPHMLVQMLFDELLSTLRQADLCIRNRDLERKSDRVSRALSIIHGLESSLDFSKGGDVAESLASIYAHVRGEIAGANRHNDPDRIRGAIDVVSEVADAWRGIA